MRFCDKLPKVRKENNLSQEQLADRLGVSRQAVSKWESGSSYPDMDKILQMCKVLDCKLEDLLDDGTIGPTKKESKINLNNVFNDFLSFITKTYNMFCSMTFKEKFKCVCEMLFIVFLLFISGGIVCMGANNLILEFFLRIPAAGSLIHKIFESLLIIGLIIIGLIILIHMLKIRYLDYYVTIEDKDVKEKTVEDELPDEKIVGNKKYIIEKDKAKVIIRDPKHSTLSFIHFLGKIIIFIIKIFTCIIVCPVLFAFVLSAILAACSIVHIGYGIMFLWISTACVGIALLTYVIIAFIYNFIFNREIKFKLYFNLAITGIALAAVSAGLTSISYMNYNHVNPLDGEKLTATEYIEMKDNIGIYSYYDNLDYVIDNSLTNIKIDVTYPEGSNYKIKENKTDEYDNYHIYIEEYDNIFKAYKMITKDLRKGIIRDYNCGDNLLVTITLSQENYDKLKKY